MITRYGHRTLQPAPPAAELLLASSLDLDIGVYARHISEPPGMAVACTDVMPALSVRPAPLPSLAAVQGMPPDPGQVVLLFIADQDRALALEVAMTAAAQLARMCWEDEPLWVRGGGGGGCDVMDAEEFRRRCPSPIDLKHREQLGGVEMRTEGTRGSALVIMNSITLVDIFLDVNKWMEMFPTIVYTAKTIQIITTGISGPGNGSLQLIHAEFQFLSPLVPTRETYFFRFCQQNPEGTWTVVDFPVDGFCDGLQVPLPNYKRRLAGCVIQDMPNGYSKVSWVELSDVEDKSAHPIFDPFISSGRAFGAQRWLAILQRQCERLASLMARNVSDLGVIPSPEARRNLMKLSHRMVRTFCANICWSSTPSWTSLSDAEDDTVRITTWQSVDPGQPNGVVLCAVSTTWLPCSHDEVFELLTDEQRRSQLDVLCGGNSLQEIAHIANGSHQRNCVSLLRINASSNSSQNVELVLQESSTHPIWGSLVVYANVDVNGIQLAMSGDDPSCIPLLPMGFIMLPAAAPPRVTARHNSSGTSDGGISAAPFSTGCLLTVGLHMLASAVPSAKLNQSSVNAINNHLCNAVHQISIVLSGSGAGGGAPPNVE